MPRCSHARPFHTKVCFALNYRDTAQQRASLRHATRFYSSSDILTDTKLIIDSAQTAAHQAVNIALVQRNWLLGRRIAEEELRDATRSELYGRRVVAMLAKELTKEYGRGFTKRNLYQYVQLYRELLRVKDVCARAWYEQEAANQGWSVKALSRNISSQYCERMLSNHVEQKGNSRAHGSFAHELTLLSHVYEGVLVPGRHGTERASSTSGFVDEGLSVARSCG